jgi:acetyltransferase-like isoleucine patch superfamily enzyme
MRIADGAHIGLNATARENLTIGRNSTLGMGAVLTKDMGEYEIWAGNPAKFLRKAK